MKPGLCSLSLLSLIMITGCGQSAAQVEAARMDRQVEQGWMDGHEVMSAIQFFEGGGHYEDLEPVDGEPLPPSVDREHILPLARRLQSELNMESQVVLIDKETAFALVARLPTDDPTRARLRTILNEADDAFPGFLFDNWGEKWLSLDFLSEQEAEVLKEAGALDLLAKRNR